MDSIDDLKALEPKVEKLNVHFSSLIDLFQGFENSETPSQALVIETSKAYAEFYKLAVESKERLDSIKKREAESNERIRVAEEAFTEKDRKAKEARKTMRDALSQELKVHSEKLATEKQNLTKNFPTNIDQPSRSSPI